MALSLQGLLFASACKIGARLRSARAVTRERIAIAAITVDASLRARKD